MSILYKNLWTKFDCTKVVGWSAAWSSKTYRRLGFKDWKLKLFCEWQGGRGSSLPSPNIRPTPAGLSAIWLYYMFIFTYFYLVNIFNFDSSKQLFSAWFMSTGRTLFCTKNFLKITYIILFLFVLNFGKMRRILFAE